MTENIQVDNRWIKLKLNKKSDTLPSEIRIDITGDIFIDGEPYDAARSKYKNLSIDVEHHNRMSSGEETQRIIEESKRAKKGEFVVLKDDESPDKKEITTVKF